MKSDTIFVDVQGFKDFRNKFILKELAIATFDCTHVFLIKPPFPYKLLRLEEKKQVNWIQRNRGIYWNEGYINYADISKLIIPFLENKCILVKGLEKIEWIKEFCENCKIVDLGEKGCPNFFSLYKSLMCESKDSIDITCCFHKQICALKNVISLRKWYIDNNIILFKLF